MRDNPPSAAARIAPAAARIVSVQPQSPAAQAGLASGMVVLSIEDSPLQDLLDWHWLSDELQVTLEVAPETAGEQEPSETESQTIVMTREPGEAWGLDFSEALFDGLRHCVNNCNFCFMKMLPKGMRSSLYERDDDYRLSFLQGNFVTLTNLSDEDIERIVQMHLSPLNVSLHAICPEVREEMMGSNHARGVEVLEQLLQAGIEIRAQIVLMPGVNDGSLLAETLDWILARPGIVAAGIVPYGYTQYAGIQRGFDTPESARKVIMQVEHLAPRVQLADEFYVKAWPSEVLAHLPEATHYNGYPMHEDGIGMLRSFVSGCNNDALLANLTADPATLLVTGEAFAVVLRELWPDNSKQILAVKNHFFGGNVDVAGLLTATDIIEQIAQMQVQQARQSQQIKQFQQLLLPAAMFNDSGLTLDDKTAADIADALSLTVKVLDFT